MACNLISLSNSQIQYVLTISYANSHLIHFIFAKTLRNTYQLLKFVLSLANSLWILSRSLELTMSSLSGTPIHHAFIIFLANSFWIDFSSKSYFEFTIFIAKSFWIHFLFLQINYDFTMNSLSFSRFQHKRDFNMNAISVTRIHYGLIFFFANPVWINHHLCELTRDPLLISRNHYGFTISHFSLSSSWFRYDYTIGFANSR